MNKRKKSIAEEETKKEENEDERSSILKDGQSGSRQPLLMRDGVYQSRSPTAPAGQGLLHQTQTEDAISP